MFLVKNCSDVRFLLAEGMVAIKKELDNFEVLLECVAPILHNILIYEISMPEIKLSGKVPPTTIDPKWLLERTIEVQ